MTELSEQRRALLIALEQIIGRCYNPHSTRTEFFGPGEWDVAEVGREFNYPLRQTDPNNIRTRHYKFGANEMYIIENLERLLVFLENRFGFEVDSPDWIAGFTPGGVVVGQVLDGHSAELGGLLRGDIIISAEGKPVMDMGDFKKARNTVPPGGVLRLTVLRSGVDKELSLLRPAEASSGT